MTFKELLKEHDCTASRLSRAIGVSRTAVGMWQNGEATPGVDKAAKIAKVLNVSIEQVAQCFLLQNSKEA